MVLEPDWTARPATGLPETAQVLAVRHAVRAWCREFGFDEVIVALSGGADSSALLLAAASTARAVHAVVIDHQLQDGSAATACAAARLAESAGCASVQVIAVQVGDTGGIEAAARKARYRALSEASRALGSLPVLLGHTRDDQAETVLLGLARGSGPRSIAGMRAWSPPWGRPLLSVGREVTQAMCRDCGIIAFDDPHNTDPRFTRVRLRHEVLPLLDQVLGGGVRAALTRTADQLREDNDALDELAAPVYQACLEAGELRVDGLQRHSAAIRRRVIRIWLLAGGARALRESQLRAVDALVSDWRGQGGVALGRSGAPAGSAPVPPGAPAGSAPVPPGAPAGSAPVPPGAPAGSAPARLVAARVRGKLTLRVDEPVRVQHAGVPDTDES